MTPIYIILPLEKHTLKNLQGDCVIFFANEVNVSVQTFYI